MNLRGLAYIAITFGILPMIGWATIMEGDDHEPSTGSDPSCAMLMAYDVNGMLVSSSRSPMTLRLRLGDGPYTSATYRVVSESPGHPRTELWIYGSLEAGWYLAGDTWLGGFHGWLIVDPATGAMWNIPSDVSGEGMEPSIASSDEGALQVALVDEVPQEWLAQAVVIVAAR